MILVTGAGGTVGTAVLEELRKLGHKPRAAYHSRNKAEQAKAAGYEAVVLDFAEPQTLQPALKGIEAVFLLGTGVIGQADQETNVVKAAKTAGVKKLVKLSVLKAATEDYKFGKMHRAVEREVEASGLAWTFLRPNSFMQNFITYMGESIRSEGAFYEPAADAKISHIDVRDIARVAALALSTTGHEGKAYELSGPTAFSYHEAAKTLSNVLGKEIQYIAVSDDDARASMVATGIPDIYADYLVDLNRLYRRGGGTVITSTIKDVTGREPIDFEQFARDYREAFQ
jgi:uncharacterized protein YbjT (DUF2867 family)